MPHLQKPQHLGSLALLLLLGACNEQATTVAPSAPVETAVEASVADVQAANAAAAEPLPTPDTPEAAEPATN